MENDEELKQILKQLAEQEQKENKQNEILSHYNNESSQKNVENSGNIGYGILGFFIPLVGFILWLVWVNDRPKDAKYSGIGALIAVILYFVVFIGSFLFGYKIGFDFVKNLFVQ